MFTGLIEEVGTISCMEQGQHAIRIGIRCQKILSDITMGCSIAVNGVCLTVTGWDKQQFFAYMMPESVRSTAWNQYYIGMPVNLERALSVQGRFDGHMVGGHIDGTAILLSKVAEAESVIFTFRPSPTLLDCIAYKGSIAINGISLTVSHVTQDTFSVSLIPHSLQETTMGQLQVNDTVNIETDLVARYIKHILLRQQSVTPSTSSTVTLSFLQENGFA